MIWLLVLLASTTTCNSLRAAESETPAAAKQAVTLKVGDPAPAYQPGKWLQGDPVATFDRDHVYLLEFWATWCGPCKAAIPHVNELHEKFKDKGLVVIGQNVWEDDASKVEPFVKSMAGKLNYRVAADEGTGKAQGRVADAWLKASGQRGIPATYLVDKSGKIAWMGHPMALKESMIESLLAGTFSPAAAKENENPQSKDIGIFQRDFYSALTGKDWPAAEAALMKIEDATGKENPRTQLARVQFLASKGDNEAAAGLALKVAEANKTDVFVKTMLATALTRESKPAPVLLDAAEKICLQNQESLNGKDGSSLITLARIAFIRGDQAKAVEYQTQAVELAKPAAKPRMNEFLESYKAGKLPEPRANRSAAEDRSAVQQRPAPGLKVGDPAPAYLPGKWFQGEPVTAFDRDHAYLIEFWATWCGPCKAAIPHVNELHEKFKDKGLIVIGQNVWEDDVSKVEPFVKSMAGKLNYRIVADEASAKEGKGRVADAWLKGSGTNGIPATFLIDKNGTIAWIGHPMKLAESDIEQLLAGTFQIKKTTPTAERQAEVKPAGLSEGELQAYAALRAKNWPAAETALETIRKESPDDAVKVDTMRLEILLAKGDEAATAATLAEKIVAKAGTNLPLKDSIAERLARSNNPSPEILAAAERIALAGNEALNGKNVSSLNTLARVAFLRGDQAKAVELQTQAFDLSKPAAQPRMKLFLDAYKEGHLPDMRARPR